MTVWDRFKRWPAGLLSAALLCGLVMQAPQAGAQVLDYDQPWIMPFDVNGDEKPESQAQVFNFVWQTFVALNWPQLQGGARAQPDTSAGLAPWGDAQQSEGPVVWQSYRHPNEVFEQPKNWPISWSDPSIDPQTICPPVEGLQPLIIDSFATNYSDNSDGLNQPFIQANYPTGPVADQNGNYLRYEVGLNQAYFTYIGHFRYYDPHRQTRAVREYVKFVEQNGVAPPASNRRNAKQFQALPNGNEAYLKGLPDYAHQGMVEWKSSWKVLGGDDIPERFYRRFAYFLNPDGSCSGPVLVGLTGLHMHRFVPNAGHIGATFEQVDNTRLQAAYSSLDVEGAAGLPAHASLNPGGQVSPIYPNGYEVCDSQGNNCQSGIAAGQPGGLPTPIRDGDVLPNNPEITNIVRQVPIDEDVQAVNAVWRERLKGSVWFYYQMIGAQNANIDTPNPNLGPGVRGAQVSSTNHLINTTLESYTQNNGTSCAGCHQNASPLGVSLPLPPFGEAWDALHTISFLLQNAQTNGND